MRWNIISDIIKYENNQEENIEKSKDMSICNYKKDNKKDTILGERV
jgi:hypothetical protein